MLRLSLPFGKFFGVDVRVHLSFVVLLTLAAGYSAVTTGSAFRGVGLWLALCFAVLVREVARAIAAAHSRLELRALVLLPVGGVMAFAASREHPRDSRSMKVAGPVANFGMGLLLLGTCYAFEPHANLFAQPWIGVTHVLRSFVWTQFILGIVSLLPTTLPASTAIKSKETASGGIAAKMPSISLSTGMAVAAIVAGFVMMNQWVILLGAFMLLGGLLSSSQSGLNSPDADSIQVREVMLTEYTLLSTSDTLGSALERTVHSLQDVFPVVRGDRLVGSVARSTIAENLQVGGDSYLQGVMTRQVHAATAEEPLVEALRRTASLGATEFIPVLEGDAMLGILTPQSLGRAMQQVKSKRTVAETRDRE